MLIPEKCKFSVELKGDVLKGFLLFEEQLGLNQSAALRLIVAEYLTLIGYVETPEPADTVKHTGL